MLIRALGHECEFATNPLTVVKEVERCQPTFVILDLGMPELDGYTLARQLREAFGFDAFYLVALSGFGTAADREQSRKAGFDAHLVKPGEAGLMVAMFNEVCGTSS